MVLESYDALSADKVTLHTDVIKLTITWLPLPEAIPPAKCAISEDEITKLQTKLDNNPVNF